MNTSVATQLGIYTEDGFLDGETCESLKASVRAGSRERAQVYGGGTDYVLDESRRSAFKVSVSDSAASSVKGKLLAKCEEFSRRFRVEVKGCQEPTFLVYKPGDFFEPHRDHTEGRNAPDHITRRRVSAVVFLNDETSGGVVGEYEGGALAFYGLLKDPRCGHIGVPVMGKAGTLVAFRSDVYHQVSPVTKGERVTVVSWYF